MRHVAHTRFAFALFLSLALHAALAGLLRGGWVEPAPREAGKIMRISLAEPRGGGSPVSSIITPEASQPQPAQPIERAATPAAQVRTPPRPNAGQPKQAGKNETPPQKTSQTVEKSVPSSIQSGSAQRDNVQEGNAQQGSAQQGNAREAAPALTPGSGGVGGGTGAVVDASRLRVTKKVPAEYPMISRRRKDQGTVVLILSIRSGRVTKAEVEKSSGHSALDESAKKAVSAWEFDISGFGDFISARISFVFSLTGVP